MIRKYLKKYFMLWDPLEHSISDSLNYYTIWTPTACTWVIFLLSAKSMCLIVYDGQDTRKRLSATVWAEFIVPWILGINVSQFFVPRQPNYKYKNDSLAFLKNLAFHNVAPTVLIFIFGRYVTSRASNPRNKIIVLFL